MKQLRNFSARVEENKSDKEYINDALQKYGGLKEDELVSLLLENVSKSKANGTYDPAQMAAFIEKVSPLVTAEQREKLRNVVTLINSDDVR